jgi:hypothetical protein
VDPEHSVGPPRVGSATISSGITDICWSRLRSPRDVASHDSRRWHWA